LSSNSSGAHPLSRRRASPPHAPCLEPTLARAQLCLHRSARGYALAARTERARTGEFRLARRSPARTSAVVSLRLPRSRLASNGGSFGSSIKVDIKASTAMASHGRRRRCVPSASASAGWCWQLACRACVRAARSHGPWRRQHDSTAETSRQHKQPRSEREQRGSCGRQRRRLEARGGRIGDVGPRPKSAVRGAFFRIKSGVNG